MSRIGELLIKNGIITQEQLSEALEHQKKVKKRLGEILIELGYLTNKNLMWMLSEQADIPFVEIRPEMLDKNLINTFPENILYNGNILPLYETEATVYIALGDPTDARAINDIKKFTTKEVKVSGADPQKIEQLLNKFFLSQQAEQTIQVERAGKSVLKIKAKKAIIEYMDEEGRKTKKISSLEVIINMEKEEGEKENG